MSVFTDRFCFGLSVAVYGLGMLYSLLLWRRGFRRDDHVLYGMLVVGAALHTGAMFLRGFTLNRCPINNLFEATMFVGWTMVVSYLAIGWHQRLRHLAAFASPLLFAIGVFALMPALDERGPRPGFNHGWQSLHAALILLAYGGFGLSSLAAIMYLVQERNLKLRKTQAILAFFPPIQRLEAVTWRFLTAGFSLLTLGLVVGAFWLKHREGYFFSADPKILWSFLVWVLYLGLWIAHSRFSQGGRRFAWGSVGSFAFVLLTFWSFNLLSSIHHPDR